MGIGAALAAGPGDVKSLNDPDRGAIEGRITYEGTPPPPTIVVEGGSTQHVLHVDKAGALRYAVVFLTGLTDTRDAGPAPSMTAAVVNQRSFIFEPQVLAVRAGQAVRFTSEDSANHNVRSSAAAPANVFSIYTGAGGGYVHRLVATPGDRPVVLSCDIHPWMTGWIYVFGHSYFAVTDAAGRFRIENVPPGRRRLAIRQPAGRLARDLSMQVVAGRSARQDVRFTPADLETLAR